MLWCVADRRQGAIWTWLPGLLLAGVQSAGGHGKTRVCLSTGLSHCLCHFVSSCMNFVSSWVGFWWRWVSVMWLMSWRWCFVRWSHSPTPRVHVSWQFCEWWWEWNVTKRTGKLGISVKTTNVWVSEWRVDLASAPVFRCWSKVMIHSSSRLAELSVLVGWCRADRTNWLFFLPPWPCVFTWVIVQFAKRPFVGREIEGSWLLMRASGYMQHYD